MQPGFPVPVSGWSLRGPTPWSGLVQALPLWTPALLHAEPREDCPRHFSLSGPPASLLSPLSPGGAETSGESAQRTSQV